MGPHFLDTPLFYAHLGGLDGTDGVYGPYLLLSQRKFILSIFDLLNLQRDPRSCQKRDLLGFFYSLYTTLYKTITWEPTNKYFVNLYDLVLVSSLCFFFFLKVK